MMKRTNNEVLKLARAVLKQTDEAIQKFVSLESLPEPLDCKPDSKRPLPSIVNGDDYLWAKSIAGGFDCKPGYIPHGGFPEVAGGVQWDKR